MSEAEPRPAYSLSAIIVVLMIAASAGGLFIEGLYRDNIFVTSAWRGNDLVTLLVAVPTLITALILSRRGSQRAQLVGWGCWITRFTTTRFIFSRRCSTGFS